MATTIFLLLSASGLVFMICVLFALVKDDRSWARFVSSPARPAQSVWVDAASVPAGGAEWVIFRRRYEPVIWQSSSSEKSRRKKTHPSPALPESDRPQCRR